MDQESLRVITHIGKPKLMSMRDRSLLVALAR